MYRTKTNHNNTTHYARLNVPSKPPRDRGGVGELPGRPRVQYGAPPRARRPASTSARPKLRHSTVHTRARDESRTTPRTAPHPTHLPTHAHPGPGTGGRGGGGEGTRRRRARGEARRADTERRGPRRKRERRCVKIHGVQNAMTLTTVWTTVRPYRGANAVTTNEW